MFKEISNFQHTAIPTTCVSFSYEKNQVDNILLMCLERTEKHVLM